MKASGVTRLAGALTKPARSGPDTVPSRGAVLRHGTITALGAADNAGLVQTDVTGAYWCPVHAGYEPFVGDLVYIWQQGPVSQVGGKLTPSGTTVRPLRTDADAADAALRLTATGATVGGTLTTGALIVTAGSATQIRNALEHSGGFVGFYGRPAVSRRTVTGSRGGNAALASLLTALETVGLIIDNSSA